ncbi:MAG: 23S rRNA (uracil(1939)-C(5))-methyltransferase RlmD [Burkholderiales bacterium]|nr:23S rRNA (uracil(1939)-C(5))-methyltransferase RlmD [Burkholderiales bacterium]
MPQVRVESLDREGRGVAHSEGRTVFIEDALPGETVEYAAYRIKPSYALGTARRVLREASARVVPRCPYFGVCGGCAMQHTDPATQVAAKQRVLEDALWHVGRVRPERILRAIHGLAWRYRHRARLSVRHVANKRVTLVGFRERRSSFVADMHSCEVLPAHVSALIDPLRALVERLSIRLRLPQIEVAVGAAVTVLVLRVLDPPDAADQAVLREFADAHGVQLWLQPRGPETARPFHPLDAPHLDYALAEFGVRIGFGPTDFTQVNPAVNALLVRRAVGLLDPRPGERILDLFCGLGNFTLPIAVRAGAVVGVEGSEALVARARRNAAANGLPAQFVVANLFDPRACAALPHCDKMLLDPPREGAVELIKALGADAPKRIVYVSCDPATLARDAGVLVNARGYRLAAAGVVNMFPHTAHIESVAVFEREA